MHQPQKKDDYSGFAVIILFALFGKAFYDFKSLGGLNYPLLAKIIYMILIIASLVILFHSGEAKEAIKQTRIEDYLIKFKSNK